MRPVRQLLMGLALAVGFVSASGAAALPSEVARAEEALVARFASRGVDYPPREVGLVALKREARLELWARSADRWTFIRSYLIRAASGRLGPKLREGDHQVPEGVYDIAALNPMSRFHLSLRVDYPNAFDRARAAEDGRERLGGDIMIHGGALSDGCLAVGDAEIEQIYALVERVGIERIRVVVSPFDLRGRSASRAGVPTRPRWLPQLYDTIAAALEPFGLPSDDEPRMARPTRRGRAGCRAWDAADCRRRCDAGDATSCAHAGVMYAVGRGAARDPQRAWVLLARACAKGDLLGCAELAGLYLDDDGPRRNADRAATLAEAACSGGNGLGCAMLARLCGERLIYPERPDECSAARVQQLRRSAVARLRTDCAGWSATDCAVLATIYDPGDPPAALRFAAGACDGGDPRGCEVLARLRDERGASPTLANIR
jgi:TPR repeat protein